MEFKSPLTQAQSAALEAFFDTLEDDIARIEAAANCIDHMTTLLDEMNSTSNKSPENTRRTTEYAGILYLAVYALRNVAHDLNTKYTRLFRADALSDAESAASPQLS